MKKALALLLAIVMVFSLLPMTAFAAEAGGKITFTTTFTNDLKSGDTFTVTASLSENPGLASFTNSLKWNDDVVQFNGFQKKNNGRPQTEVFASDCVNVFNDETGIATSATDFDNEEEGILYVAEFQIIADEGALDLGLTTTEFGQKFTFANAAGTDIMPELDFTAISDLYVGGKAPDTGVAIPEGAPFTAITTDAGPIIAIEEQDDVNGVPYYIVTIPEDAETAYVTAPDQVVMEDYTTGEMQATAYAYDVDNNWNQLFISYDYEESEDGPVVEIPMYMVASDWSGEVELCFVEDEDGYLTHAFGIENASYACLGIISFRYGTAPEGGEEETTTYDITVQQTTGGTVTVYNEAGEEITEAAAGEYVLVQVAVATGYKLNYVTVNGEPNNLENGFFKMPAEAVEVSAVFEEIHTCEYKEVTAEAFLKQEATCQSGAVYYKSCDCGEVSENTFISGDPVECVYVDGFCKWCGAAEPVVTPGFRFATSADVSAENGGTAVVKVMITGHSDPNVTKYNAYDVTLTYDSDKLEYQGYDGAVLSDNGEVEVDEENGTIRIVGCGADKDFGTEIAALTFKTKAEGEATVTIDKVLVAESEEAVKDAPEATPKHQEEDPDADETPDVSVVVVPYSVTKPDFISGNDKILHGEDYTFSYSDTTNYTYSDLTVKVGGVEVENLTSDENGVYTIANVTGAIEITATQTPNSYDVTKPENVTGPDKATYGTPYVFTVTPSKEDMAIDTVTVKYADGSEVPYTVNENGEYVIAGTDITGAFTITVTEKEKMTTITFSGIEEDEIDGGKLTMAAEIGKDFTFKLIKKEGFDYTVKVGETELTESKEVAGQYTIPAEQVVKGGVTVAIEKVDNTTATVDVVEYINLDGKTMFLVTAKWGEKVLAYGEGNTMYWSDKYTVTGETEAGAYCWLVVSTEEMKTIDQVKAAAEAAIVEAAKDATATTIKYNYDINGTTKVDVNDAQLAYDMYNASYMDFTENLPMLKFLEADVKTDSKLDTQDVAAIISFIVSGANA